MFGAVRHGFAFVANNHDCSSTPSICLDVICDHERAKHFGHNAHTKFIHRAFVFANFVSEACWMIPLSYIHHHDF
jgi:hypothetical protein